MSKVAFSITTALMGSAVRSRLLYAAQNVIARRHSTPNAALSTPNATLSSPNVTLSTLYAKAPNAKALNSISRNPAGLRPNYFLDSRKSCCLAHTLERTHSQSAVRCNNPN